MTLTTPLGYDALPGLLARMTGDEKHDPSSYSTLDVLWVLYDRVLPVVPRPAHPSATASSSPRATARPPYYAVLAAKGFLDAGRARRLRRVRLASRLPPRPAARPRRRDLERLARARPADRRRRCARAARGPPPRVLPRRRRRARRGQQLGGDPVRGPRSGLDGLTAVVVDNDSASFGWPGGIEQPVRGRGLDGRAGRRTRPRRARARRCARGSRAGRTSSSRRCRE